MNGQEILKAALQYKESAQTTEEHQELLRFSLDNEWYGIGAINVKEVVKCPSIFGIPHTPDHIIGVANLRGEVLAIVDIRSLLGLPTDQTKAWEYVVVAERRAIRVGIVADEVSDLISIPTSAIKPSISNSDGPSGLVEGETQLGEDVLVILNMEELLKAPEE